MFKAEEWKECIQCGLTHIKTLHPPFHDHPKDCTLCIMPKSLEKSRLLNRVNTYPIAEK